MTFQIHALPPEQFNTYYGLTDNALVQKNAKRISVDSKPGYLCRISLKDVEVGESIIILNYVHQPNTTPYQASHAIFISENSKQCHLQKNEIPQDLSIRHFSVRAFNKHHFLIGAELSKGKDLPSCIETLFKNEHISYLHLHHSAHGCFAASVTRT